MKVAVFDIHPFEKPYIEEAFANSKHQPVYIDQQLSERTWELAKGYIAVCCFVNDQINEEVICQLACRGTQLIALRSAGFNNVDLHAAAVHGIKVVRVPSYSPYAVAEHAMGLVLCLNRKIHRAHQRVRELNFSLDGLVGFDMHGKTVGVVGTGKIGAAFSHIARGFGCRVLAFDQSVDVTLLALGNVEYCTLEKLMASSDVVSLHLPLTPATHHLVNENVLSLMKPNALLVNTSRGELIQASSLIDALKLNKIGGAGLDVYEEEADIFFEDFSDIGVQDDVLARLLTFPNVIVTAHQGFLTREALTNIAQTTVENLDSYADGSSLINEIPAELQVKVGCRRHTVSG